MSQVSTQTVESQKRAVALAVARYGVDRAQAERILRAVLHGHSQGRAIEVVDALAAHKLLTPSQAASLRRDLPAPAAVSASGNVHAAAGRNGASGATDAAVSDVLPTTSSGRYLRTIGEYRLLRSLGQGGMGSVYLGYAEGQESQFAIKVLSDQLASNDDFVKRFYREARSGTHLNHPNIVRCIKAGQDQATAKHYLVLEYIDGPSAHALLERFDHLTVGDAVHIILDVARALEHAHSRNIIHRDIKPDNILVTKSGVAKLADLGLAKRLDEISNLTGLRQGFGSLHYIPYEQAFDAKRADTRSDIYALGATFYHLLTGELPFAGKTHIEIAEKKATGALTPASVFNADVPPVLEGILLKMLARFPEDRYQMVSELIVDLERTGLEASVPSFVDRDQALQDPLVRAKLNTAQPTQLDIGAEVRQVVVAATNDNVWYVRYRTTEGRWCKSKLTAAQIRERLVQGRIPATVQASRQPQGEFRPLQGYAEFRELDQEVSAHPKEPKTGGSDAPAPDQPWWRRRVVIAAGVGLSALAGLGFYWLLAAG